MKDPTLFERQCEVSSDGTLGMYYCGKRVQTPHHSYGPLIRDHYLFVLVNSGEAILHGETDLRLKEHDLLVMCPGERIHYDALTPWSIQWIGLYGDAVSHYMKQLGIDGKHPILPVTFYKELEHRMEKIYLLSQETSATAKLSLTGMIYDFFSILFESANLKGTTDYIASAVKIIDYNLSFDLTVEMLAEKVHLNPSYFSRLFVRRMGMSPKQYILEKKIARAKEFLDATEASILEISNSVGFLDPLYFSRIFKKKVGVGPEEYRKQERKEASL